MATDRSPRDLRIEYRPIQGLHPNPRNARTHSPAQLRQLVDSIRQFGFTNPILIDETGQVLADHGRLEAARQLGWTEVPIIHLASMTEAEKRAYVIADNRLAEKAGWDPELLAKELQFLTELDLDFDVTITGFEMAEIDLLIGGNTQATDEADDIPAVADDQPVISRLGDLYTLGAHRLLCGDATRPDTFAQLLSNQRATLVFTDPPYNVPIAGHVSGLGAIQHREFPMASGEMTSAEFTAFLQTALRYSVEHSKNGAIHYVCIDWRHMPELLQATTGLYSDQLNLCVWAKTNGGMGSLYRSQHELILVLKVGTAPHVNNVELGKHGRYRTNLWTYPGVNTFRPGRDDELAMHPTVKPVALVADALLDCSKRRDLVLDPFGGSGTTLIAAEKTGRRGYLLELDPGYVDVTVRRWERLTGQEARHTGTGLTFTALAATRLGGPPGSPSASQEVGHG